MHSLNNWRMLCERWGEICGACVTGTLYAILNGLHACRGKCVEKDDRGRDGDRINGDSGLSRSRA